MRNISEYPTKRRVFGLGELIAVLIFLLLAFTFAIEDVKLGSLECEAAPTLEASSHLAWGGFSSLDPSLGRSELARSESEAASAECEPTAPSRFAER